MTTKTRKLTNTDLKPHWKYTCPRGRFYYDTDADGLVSLVDGKYGMLICPGDGKYWEAIKYGWFAKNYVRIHGDIDFRSFPYTLWSALHYNDNDLHVIDDKYLNEFDREKANDS